jgi:hypothetical protein
MQAFFVNPIKDEIHAISAILICFGKASGLVTNLANSEVFAVRCGDIDLNDLLAGFPAKIMAFPGKYLGPPLHFCRLRKVDIQPLIDKITGKLSGWFGKNLARPGRITLAKSVLMATAVYHAMVLPLPKWARDKINKIARNFISAGDDGDHASGGHALVNWKTVCMPKELGGLGMPDLEHTGRVLRLRWPWLRWTDPQKSWVGSKLPFDDADMDLFRAATKITIGNGEYTSFWFDSWTDRGALKL